MEELLAIEQGIEMLGLWLSNTPAGNIVVGFSIVVTTLWADPRV